MWPKINYTARAAKTLDLSIDETKELSNRMYGHFKQNGIKKEQILKSFFILASIYQRKEQIKLDTTAPLLGFKNIGIQIYKGTIVKLHDACLSSHEIYKHLKQKKMHLLYQQSKDTSNH